MGFFKVERDKRKATVLIKSQGEIQDKKIISKATEIAYDTKSVITVYRDDGNCIVILFSNTSVESLEKIKEFYNIH